MTELTLIDSVPPDKSVVEILESLLEMAREGKFGSIAVATVYRDGTTGDAWSAPTALGTQIGAVSILHARLVNLVTTKD